MGGQTVQMTDGIGEIHQGADAVKHVMQLIMNVRSKKEDGPKRKLEEMRREKEECISSLDKQCTRLKARIKTSNSAWTERDVAAIEKIEDQVDVLSDKVVAVNMQISKHTHAEEKWSLLAASAGSFHGGNE
jgi:uncharacterized protein Yka (UPF0111/DUF47 family)